MANKIQLRRGTKAQLAALGPLAVGEPGYTTDTRELVVGNGTGANTLIVTATSADITYYVRTDGNDSNTGLANTVGGAFKTWAKAHSMIPSDVNHIVLVYVAPGSYAEPLIIKGRSGGGYIHVIGGGTTAAAAGYTFQSLDIEFNDLVIGVDGFTFTNTGGAAAISSYNSKQVMVTLCRIVAASSFGAFFFYSCPAGVVTNCEISNRARAIESAQNSKVMAQNNTGSGNAFGLYASDGGEIRQAGTMPAGLMATPNSGSILYDSGVIGPWGDNTFASRSYARVYQSTAQSIAAATSTKLHFQNEMHDNLLEFDTSLSRFTAQSAGVYTISASYGVTNQSTALRAILMAYVNGGENSRLADMVFPVGNVSSIIGGTSSVYLGAGDYLELYAYTSSAQNLIAGITLTYAQIVRTA